MDMSILARILPKRTTQVSKTDVATIKDNALPAHLQNAEKRTIGNVDNTDIIVPRVKLLQAISPEVTENDAKAGTFWHTIAGESLGTKIRAIPIIIRKSYVLWSPRNDERGILARANDGLNWDNAGMEFTVKPKNSPHQVTYKLGKTVHEKTGDGPALSEFGSSIPGDPKSPPAAALTYQMLWYFPDFAEMSPAIIINTRSSVKPAQSLISKIEMRPVDARGQVYEIGIVQEKGAEGPFLNYTYKSDGYATEEEFEFANLIYEKFATAEWRANEETGDTDVNDVGGRGGSRSGGATMDEKDIAF